jgi:serine/threonine-protein kinase HipA
MFGDEEVVPHLQEELLRSLMLSGTSKGVLRKFTANIEGSVYYIKAGKEIGNSYSNIQPTCEVIAYELGGLLGFNCASYELAVIPMERLDAEDDVIVCVSKSFLVGEGEEFVPFAKLAEDAPVYKNSDLYTIFCEKFPDLVENFDQMIVLDYLLDNPDRHLNNFGIVTNFGRSYRFAPFFDHGYGLLGQYDERELPYGDENLIRRGKALPFRNKQSKAIELVKDVGSLGLNLSVDVEEALQVFDKYSFMFSPSRLELMKKMFAGRYEVVRNKI